MRQAPMLGMDLPNSGRSGLAEFHALSATSSATICCSHASQRRKRPRAGYQSVGRENRLVRLRGYVRIVQSAMLRLGSRTGQIGGNQHAAGQLVARRLDFAALRHLRGAVVRPGLKSSAARQHGVCRVGGHYKKHQKQDQRISHTARTLRGNSAHAVACWWIVAHEEEHPLSN